MVTATALLLKLTPSSSLRWKSHMVLSIGSPPPPPPPPPADNLRIIKPTGCSKSLTELRASCFNMNHVTKSLNNFEEKNTIMIVSEAMKAFRNLAATIVFLGLLWTMICGCNPALAGSGGRMGGSRSSSSRSSSRLGRRTSLPDFLEKLVDDADDADSLSSSPPRSTVFKLQVGSINTGRSLQKDINRIAKTADTSSFNGSIYILKETIQSLLKHLEYCTSCYTYVVVDNYIEEGLARFEEFSTEAWRKIDEKTLVNVNNVKRKSVPTLRAGGSDGHIVITILVVAQGVHELPIIKSGEDLKRALEKLCSIPTSHLHGIEVIWTPENETDTLSEHELLEYYPVLRSLSV